MICGPRGADAPAAIGQEGKEQGAIGQAGNGARRDWSGRENAAGKGVKGGGREGRWEIGRGERLADEVRPAIRMRRLPGSLQVPLPRNLTD